MGYNSLRTKDLLQKVKKLKSGHLICCSLDDMNQLIIADREEHSERNNESFSENLILNFSNYSPASDLLESLNREKVIKIVANLTQKV